MEKLMFVFFMSLMFFFFTQLHPFFMSINLILTTMFMILIFFNSKEYWMNFIVVMIYLGGILIMFVYLSSILPNFKSDLEFLYLFWFLFMATLFTSLFLWFSYNSLNLLSCASLIFYLVSFSNWNFVLMFLFMLLVTLIFSTELVWKKSGPLRNM